MGDQAHEGLGLYYPLLCFVNFGVGERRRMLDWDDLRFFLTVARHKTLAVAARHLGVTQSTVGRRLTSLQTNMGVRLLDRTASGYVPTQAGWSILAHIERVEAEALAVERAVAGLDTRLEGLVRVAGSQLLTSHILAPSFAALQTSYPDILIEVIPETEAVSPAQGDADIAVQLSQFENPDLVVRNIGTIAFGLYACVAYLARHGEPEFSDGWAGHRLITLLDDRELSAQEAWLKQHARQAKVTFKADSYESQYWAAYCSGGLALLPRFRADPEPALRLNATPVSIPPANVWLGVHRDSRDIPRVRVVLDCIAEAVRIRATDLNPDS